MPHGIFIYRELASVEIMAKDLLTYISGYHLDITGQFQWKVDQILSMPCKTWEYLIIIYIWLAFGCLNGDTWQVIAILAKTVMKTDTHILLALITQTKYKKLVVSSQFSHSILWDFLRIKW